MRASVLSDGSPDYRVPVLSQSDAAEASQKRPRQKKPSLSPPSFTGSWTQRSIRCYVPILIAVIVIWVLLQALLFYYAIAIAGVGGSDAQRTAAASKLSLELPTATMAAMVPPSAATQAVAEPTSARRITTTTTTAITEEATTRVSVSQAAGELPLLAYNVSVDPSLWGGESMLSAYTSDERYQMLWEYGAGDKDWPYVGNPHYLRKYFSAETPVLSREKASGQAAPQSDEDVEKLLRLPRSYYNILAVFPGADTGREHGILGRHKDARPMLHPSPSPLPAEQVPGGLEAALKKGGFYLALSDALPLDRTPLDSRDAVCKTVDYDLLALDDVSIVITFYNEPLSTLLRSVHSVLNHTPPPILREIILVDDHSNLPENLPGGPLDAYICALPKVKLMRMPERRGIVPARLAGARLSTAPVLVILDSHVEMPVGWLEPQLQRLKESPKSIVFPQILEIDSANFSYRTDSGIGCFLSFKWSMQERPYMSGGEFSKPDAFPSASMAGGLFAIRREWFFDLGGYDEEFSMWGAENVELAFRTWQCGGRVECAPCSKVYHIYRTKGTGYTSPPRSLTINRLRTARIWTDEFYPLAKNFIRGGNFTDADLGSFDRMLALKDRLQCKSFSWFLENVDKEKVPRHIDDITFYAEIRKRGSNTCLDNLQHRDVGEKYGTYGCHGEGGSQSFFTTKGSNAIRLAFDETSCIGSNLLITECNQPTVDNHWIVNMGDGTIRWSMESEAERCLCLEQNGLSLLPCNGSDATLWDIKEKKLERYVPLQMSKEYIAHGLRLKQRAESEIPI